MTKIQTGPFTISLRSARPALTAGYNQIDRDNITVKCRGIAIKNHKWRLRFKAQVPRPVTVTRRPGQTDPAYHLNLLR